jgi:prepilin-type N-terminal cleavage/methylation domain-containing protein
MAIVVCTKKSEIMREWNLVYWTRSVMVTKKEVERVGGVSLIELLVVIAIVSVLLALAIPAVGAARESVRRSACQSNLRQLGLGLANFSSTHGHFPPGKKWSGPREKPEPFEIAWSALLLPFIEQTAVYDAVDFRVPFTPGGSKSTARPTGT